MRRGRSSPRRRSTLGSPPSSTLSTSACRAYKILCASKAPRATDEPDCTLGLGRDSAGIQTAGPTCRHPTAGSDSDDFSTASSSVSVTMGSASFMALADSQLSIFRVRVFASCCFLLFKCIGFSLHVYGRSAISCAESHFLLFSRRRRTLCRGMSSALSPRTPKCRCARSHEGRTQLHCPSPCHRTVAAPLPRHAALPLRFLRRPPCTATRNSARTWPHSTALPAARPAGFCRTPCPSTLRHRRLLRSPRRALSRPLAAPPFPLAPPQTPLQHVAFAL